MREIVAADQPFVREEVPRAEALERFADQPYKREIIESLEEGEVAGRGDRDRVPQRRLGGPVPRSARALDRAAGRVQADEARRRVLARRRGAPDAHSGSTAPRGRPRRTSTRYLHRLEEAEKRDHRKLGRELDLFSFPEELGPGLWVWHPRGGLFRKQLEDYVRDLHLERGYDLVVTPHIARRESCGRPRVTSRSTPSNMYPPMRHEAPATTTSSR